MSEPVVQDNTLSPREEWSLSMLSRAFEENSNLASNVSGDSQPDITEYVCPINLSEVQ